MSTYNHEEWDGYDLPYFPQKVSIPDAIDLHTEAEEDVDPITYEVVRHSLWNINREHGSTIQNLSVSTITLETKDFQTGILTENAEFVFFGPYLQWFAGTMDLLTNWIMENRGDSPGISEGDIFLNNDTWIGSPHQPDVALVAPVFHDGEIFCWVSNLMHQSDVGGTVAGSFCPNAEDIFWDPPLLPPIKIVDNGEIDEEVEHLYRRQSRTPQQLAMDLRAGIAGIESARSRISELIERYSAASVKGTMRTLIDSGEHSFQEEILSKIPDGTWRERVYDERARGDDDGVYTVELTLRKENDQLYFSNKGTADQVGVINQPFSAWRGNILGVANLLIQPEQMGATGGMMRAINFEPEPGTLNCPTYGAAVSTAGIYQNILQNTLAHSVISKMLLSSDDEELREKAASPVNGQWQLQMAEGTNQRGDYYVAPFLDGMYGSSGATLEHDGAFSNGFYLIPDGEAPSIEAYERDWPMLYLYRGEHQDTAGAGTRRSGNGGRIAYTPHKGSMELGVYMADGVPKTPGIFGGYPGSRGETRVVHGSDVNDRFAAGDHPSDFQSLSGDVELTVGKGDPIDLDDDSVVEWWWASFGGLGDPILREPERVAADVSDDTISNEHARDTYGVVLDNEGELDVDATEARRQAMRDDRLDRASTAEELGIPERGDNA